MQILSTQVSKTLTPHSSFNDFLTKNMCGDGGIMEE